MACFKMRHTVSLASAPPANPRVITYTNKKQEPVALFIQKKSSLPYSSLTASGSRPGHRGQNGINSVQRLI